MATAVIMPKQGQSVESCIIGQWHKKPGDKVSVGDILFTYETDKSTFDEEAKIEGTLLAVFYEEGDEVVCLQNVCVIGEEGENIEQFTVDNSQFTIDNLGTSRTPSPTTATNSSLQNMDSATPLRKASFARLGRMTMRWTPHSVSERDCSHIHTPHSTSISPRARALAERTKADISKAIGTGAGGRIMERDIMKVIAQGHRLVSTVQEADDPRTGAQLSIEPSESTKHIPDADIPFAPLTDDFEVVRLTNIRKIIARTMQESLQNSAQLTQHSSFDATNVIEFRKRLKSSENSDTSVKITITDIVIYAVSRVLLRHRAINAWLLGDKIAMCDNAHIGIAVDTPKGLLVPTVFNANKMSLDEISLYIRDVADKCRNGKIDPDLLKGATFTISNLGALGVEMFTPILNPPQTGILGVCSMVERIKDGKPYKAIGLSLTYDHRALDGADAARFSKDLAEYLESFSGNNYEL